MTVSAVKAQPRSQASPIFTFSFTYCMSEKQNRTYHISSNYFSVTHSATYDVQDVELQVGGENISIQCVFASGSQARGCYVEIRNISLNITMNITRSGSPLSQIAKQTVTGLTPGSYEVFIFDWESDDSVASTPSYVIVTDTATVGTTSTTSTTKGRRIYQHFRLLP